MKLTILDPRPSGSPAMMSWLGQSPRPSVSKNRRLVKGNRDGVDPGSRKKDRRKPAERTRTRDEKKKAKQEACCAVHIYFRSCVDRCIPQDKTGITNDLLKTDIPAGLGPALSDIADLPPERHPDSIQMISI